ncbi:MAG: hypothetical protein PVG14_02285 [Anaerolineales bacterium]|jgi:hypothetical protein
MVNKQVDAAFDIVLEEVENVGLTGLVEVTVFIATTSGQRIPSRQKKRN